MKTVAIVLCNYNHAKYLPDSLGHICNQLRSAEQIVVIDDGSTDGSLDIIRGFARSRPSIEVHCHERNLGLEASIAEALQLVHCDYLVWAAADDRLLPRFLDRNMAVLAGHPDAALSFSEVVVLKGDSEEIDRFATNPAAPRIFDLSDLPEFLSPDRLRERMNRGYLPIASNTAVIRIDLLREFGGFPPALRWFADSFTCTALAMRHGACVIAEPLALIRSSASSYSQTMRDVLQQTKVLNALVDLLARPEFSDIRAFLKDCPSNLTVYDPLILRLLAQRPRDWDLATAYVRWKMDKCAQLARPNGLVRRLASRVRRVVRNTLGAVQPHKDRSQ
jgi:glycosyltransferase involved in cell wall biosynthesis